MGRKTATDTMGYAHQTVLARRPPLTGLWTILFMCPGAVRILLVRHHQCTAHVAAEHWLADPIPLDGIILSKGTLGPHPSAVDSTIKAWSRIAKWLQLPSLYSPNLPLVYHPSRSLLQEAIFKKVAKTRKIHCWGDLHLNGKFRTLQQLFPDPPPTVMETFL